MLFQINKNLKDFTYFLENEITKLDVSSFSLGKEAYNKMLKNQLLLDYNNETLWDFGWKEFNNTLKKMDELALKIDPSKTTKELLIEIKNEYFDPEATIGCGQEIHIIIK